MILTDLTLDEINLILNGLGELPAKQVLSLILKIENQARPQLQAESPFPAPVPQTDAA